MKKGKSSLSILFSKIVKTNLFLEAVTKVNNEINAEFDLQDFLTHESSGNLSFQDAFYL